MTTQALTSVAEQHSAAGYPLRSLFDKVFRAACFGAVLLALVPLFSVLYYVISRGIGGLSWDFFTHLPAPVGEVGGGMGNAFLGSLQLIAMACLLGIPVGVLAGVYLAEFAGRGRFGKVVRFSADVMAGIPSITIGIFVYTVFVLNMKRFSALAGAVALAILMLPTVTRTTEELLRLVPAALREAAFGLGVPRWRTTLLVVLRTAAPGIATGVMLAVARVAGETAPLLFTAFNNGYWSQALDQPIASLPVQIYTYAVSPYEEWHQQAWGASLVLVALILTLNIGARTLVKHRVR